MAITIKGIKLQNVNISRNEEAGGYKIASAEYALISSADKVLAKQTIGAYAMTLEPSSLTVKAFDAFMASYADDITKTLGLE